MNDLIALTIPRIGGEGNQTVYTPNGIPTLSGSLGLEGIVAWIIGGLITIAVLLAFGYIIYGGFIWITSQGDKQKVESARKIIMYAVVGLLLALFSIIIVSIINSTINPPTIIDDCADFGICELP